MKKKPDNVADNPLGMAYGTNVSAPAITLPDVKGFKKGMAAEAGHRFHAKYQELEEEYNKLMEEAQYNDRLLNADIRFKPLIGNTYYLYNDGHDFISMISPEEWGESYMKGKEFVGAFKILSDNVWKKVEEDETAGNSRLQNEMDE